MKSRLTVAKTITWEDTAIARIRAIGQDEAIRILRTIGRYLVTDQGDVKRLQGIEPPEHRLRAGDYRVRFFMRVDSIHILSVKHRSQAYR
jgi:mRNA-degrading endonuclease RelE of RelBE toxin-antitoxin system